MEFIKLDATTAFDKAINALDGNPKLIVCGSKNNIEYIKEAMNFSELNPQDIIDESLKINVETWFRDRMRYAQDELGMDSEFDEDEYEDDEFEDESIGASRGKLSFTLATDILTGKPLTDLMGVELNAEECWHIPALFKYGGWNDCPEPEVQCAIWKYWQEKYGAKIVGISHDIIEAHVENPPRTQDEAMQLAMEQYLYCTDIVDQGVETVSNLAHLLLQQKVWYFWWD